MSEGPSRVWARAPASSANLGPGFDVLALAWALYVEVCVEPAPSLSVRCSGEGSGLPSDATHLAARVACAVAGHDRLAITVRSDIPPARGLGSSGALALAAAAAAGARDPLAVAADVEGHLENVAASAAGGLVSATRAGDRILLSRHRLDPALRFVVAVPDRELGTGTAREVLSSLVDRGAATFNLGRLAALLAGLGDAAQLEPAAFDDRLHQEARAVLYPEAAPLIAAMTAAGALGACWSGAGPSVLAVTVESSREPVLAAARAELAHLGLPGTVRELEPARAGLMVRTTTATRWGPEGPPGLRSPG